MPKFLILFATLLALLLPVHTAFAENGDRVQFFSNVTVPEGQEVHDVVCFFCSVEVDGTATGDIVTFFGSSRITGRAEKDMVTFLGSTEVEGSVGKDLVVFLGSARLLENASVGHDLVVFAGGLEKNPTATIGHDQVHFPGIILLPALLPFLLLGLGIFLVVRWLSRRSDPVYPYPMPPQPRR